MFRYKSVRYKINNDLHSQPVPGSQRVVVESDDWYGRYRDADGVRKTVKLCRDKRQAERLLSKIKEDVLLGRSGLTDPHAAAKAAPLAVHLTAYRNHLTTAGRGDGHIAQTVRAIQTVATALDAQTVMGISVEKLDRYIAGLRVSGRSKQYCLQAVTGFVKFLVKKRQLPNNHLAGVTRPDTTPTRRRRSLTADELSRLVAAARQRPLNGLGRVNRGRRAGQPAKLRPETVERLQQAGRDRATLYRSAYYTGLRAGELRSVLAGHVDLPGKVITLPGEFTKNGQPAVIPVHPDLLPELTVAVAGKRPDEPAFRVPSPAVYLRHLRSDMRAAGIPVRDELGRVFDFHALRHTLSTHLVLANTPVGVHQEIMRHSDPRLSLNAYKDRVAMPVRQAVESLPSLA